jgi:hypothetical protein
VANERRLRAVRTADRPVTLVDSSVILDILTADPDWAPWSSDALARAGFLAGQAFLAYRSRGGQRRSPLPDFYICAHAAVRKYRLLTRNSARYRTYFPSVEVIAP